MEDRKQKIIDTIQKCLLLSEDNGATEAEKESAKQKAGLLMAKYRIKETEVDLETDNFTLTRFFFEKDGKDVPQWAGYVVYMFCDAFDCQSVYRRKWEGTEWDIIGTFSDVETVLYFVHVVSHHIKLEVWDAVPQKKFRNKREAIGNVASTVIQERLYEIKNQMDATIHESEGCSALVVQKKEEIQEAVDAHYKNLKRGRTKKMNTPTDIKDYMKGEEIGKTAPLNFAINE